jgi:hypothetical protein
MLSEVPRAGSSCPTCGLLIEYVVPSPQKESWGSQESTRTCQAHFGIREASLPPKDGQATRALCRKPFGGRFPRLPPFCEIVGGCQAPHFVGSNQSNLITGNMLLCTLLSGSRSRAPKVAARSDKWMMKQGRQTHYGSTRGGRLVEFAYHGLLLV